MPNTTNFNWPTPADTDLVKDGAAAIRNLGNGIDTSLIDLKGGTTGQILSKASNADMDFTFITPNVGDITEVQAGVGISVASGTGPIPVITNSSTDLITTAGDLLYGTAADTMARLGIGTAGQVLKVNSGATAPEWGAAATPSYTWTSWTPASRSDITIGNGTETARYVQIGNTVFWFYQFVFGSTSSISSSPSIELPVATTATWEDLAFATGVLDDATGGEFMGAAFYILNDKVQFKGMKSDGTWLTANDISASLPFSWTTSDRIEFCGWYEVV